MNGSVPKNLYANSYYSELLRLQLLIHVLQDVFNIAPKRPNWDLKREMEKKVAKLERKTQEAVHTLIRQLDISPCLYFRLLTLYQ